jgi:hypothetical protein
MPTCNSFATASLVDSALAVSCKSKPGNLGNNGIDPLKFLFIVVDMLEQLRTNPGTLPTLASIDMCDANEALRLANCASQFVTFPPNVTMEQLQAVIIQMLNEALCS